MKNELLQANLVYEINSHINNQGFCVIGRDVVRQAFYQQENLVPELDEYCKKHRFTYEFDGSFIKFERSK